MYFLVHDVTSDTYPNTSDQTEVSSKESEVTPDIFADRIGQAWLADRT